jgi:hypothetical protein
MSSIYFDSDRGDEFRRERLYAGDLFVYSATANTRRLCDLARELIEEAFAGSDPLRLHETMPVEECAAILARLKPAFIHHPKAKEYIPGILQDLGCDPEKVYFDVPRLRSAFPTDYLTSGIAYAFHPHRDTWYSAPFCQLNWWMPVYDIVAENAMAFHPRYWSQPVRNGSHNYNYYRWNKESRGSAAQHIKSDTRVQPHAEEELELQPDIRIVGRPGEVMLFSAAQMHSTVPNTAGFTRFSIDFRTIHVEDAWRRRGARNIDSECTGTTMRDYLRATDLAHVPEEVVALYDDDSAIAEHLVFKPQVASGVRG